MTDVQKIHTIIEYIKDIINPDPTFILEIISEKAVNKVIITEERSQASLKKVTLFGFDDNTFAFRLDAKDKSDIRKTIRISEYLNPNSTKDINKGCDGIIFTCIRDKGYVLVCEMKSGVPIRLFSTI
jgi:hypothetical protein